jgi:hypothetical protein
VFKCCEQCMSLFSDAQPLLHPPRCPDTALLAGFSDRALLRPPHRAVNHQNSSGLLIIHTPVFLLVSTAPEE